MNDVFPKKEVIPFAINERMERLFREYMIVGGMPEVVAAFVEENDFNEAIRQKMCELIDIHPNLSFTTEYVKSGDIENDILDLREAIQPKHPLADSQFTPRRYYQVYDRKHGFLANLSILDLLCNMGPESIFLLQ